MARDSSGERGVDFGAMPFRRFRQDGGHGSCRSTAPGGDPGMNRIAMWTGRLLGVLWLLEIAHPRLLVTPNPLDSRVEE